MSKIERAIELNPDFRERVLAYQELYFRYLRAITDFPDCSKAIEEPDIKPFVVCDGFNFSGIEYLKRKWRKEFTMRG